MASSSANGMDAADVLPCSERVTITFSMGISNRLATAWIIRMFA